MIYQTLDNIVRSALMRKNYTLHWYLQGLKAASDCLRELTFDSLKNVNTIKLPISSTGTIDLPCDYTDWTKVGICFGQYVRPLVQKQGINRLQNLDNNGLPIPYPAPTPELSQFNLLTSGLYNGYWWSSGFTADGEMLGRWYGFNASNIQDGFKELRERGQIQFDQYLGSCFAILEYISDGQCVNSATQIHPYAQATLESYIFYQFKEHNRTIGDAERQRAQNEFSSQRRILRARLNGLTKDDILRIVRKSYGATIKG